MKIFVLQYKSSFHAGLADSPQRLVVAAKDEKEARGRAAVFFQPGLEIKPGEPTPELDDTWLLPDFTDCIDISQISQAGVICVGMKNNRFIP